MTKMVNCWNEWDPLKRVIVGRPEGTQVPAPEPAWWHNYPKFGFPLGTYGKFPQEMVDEANEQMENFVKTMEKRGIIVDRVEVHPALEDVQAFSTPDWTQLNARGIACPRDLFLPIGNEIMEATCSIRSRWYEYLNLRPLFERYFKEDPEFLWTAAPKPRLTDESFEKNYYYNFYNVWTTQEKAERFLQWKFHLTEKEPLWDAADAGRCGKDIFWQCSSVTNRSGMDWLKRYFSAKGIRIHPIQFNSPAAASGPFGDYFLHPWHIDVSLLILRPGLAVYNPDEPILTENAAKLFKINDWELIPAERPMHDYKDNVNVFGHPISGPIWISMNTFSLGPKTICVEAHEHRFIDQLTKLDMEVVPINYNKVLPFGGELHCTTLDVYREGKMEDYFPKQIPGY
ncbi:MAG: serine/threonine protein kinase [Anaerolineales bacterium]|nr:serine/threonine protein kinase [Anaerolineales bacterium]